VVYGDFAHPDCSNHSRKSLAALSLQRTLLPRLEGIWSPPTNLRRQPVSFTRRYAASPAGTSLWRRINQWRSLVLLEPAVQRPRGTLVASTKDDLDAIERSEVELSSRSTPAYRGRIMASVTLLLKEFSASSISSLAFFRTHNAQISRCVLSDDLAACLSEINGIALNAPCSG
jgi:hypothetical protein